MKPWDPVTRPPHEAVSDGSGRCTLCGFALDYTIHSRYRRRHLEPCVDCGSLEHEFCKPITPSPIRGMSRAEIQEKKQRWRAIIDERKAASRKKVEERWKPIREDRARGMTLKALSLKYGISVNRIAEMTKREKVSG